MVKPQIVTIISGKGGAGKTTTVVNVGARLGKLGRKKSVLVVDADAQDAGSAAWHLGRNDDAGIDIAAEPAEEGMSRDDYERRFIGLLDQLRGLDDRDWVLIDTIPVLDSPVTTKAIEIADFLVIPSMLGPGDIARLVQTVRGAAEPSGKPFAAVLGAVDPRRLREAESARETLIEVGIPVLGIVRHYTAVQRGSAHGLVVGQFQGRAGENALEDFEAVTAALLEAIAPARRRRAVAGLSDVIGNGSPKKTRATR